MQEARIRIGLAANLRLFVVALAIGGVLGALAVVGIVGAALDELARLDAPADPYAYAPASQRDEILSVLVPALLFVSAVLPIVCLRLRSGRRARVTWDEAGVTEWEGERVRAFDGATSVTLPDGRTMPADASALRHPDARVLTRGGTVRAALEVSAGGDAYRGAPAQAIVRAVETDAERAERRRLIFANLLEVVARVVHALLVLTIGVLVVTRIQGF